MSKTSLAYIKCPKCGCVRFKKRNKVNFECTRCGFVRRRKGH